ncbi:type I-C CRISPR-associated protein Cas8c/Csd1 [Lapidilactobacillus wuchangensis]|uniref:type I-C CRISPR-associated protein Cas8c/Csd1 n=1 Tax=Lapidilactobacillus wuchangensis TaxID=2486001 RepID=UPI000F781F8D|nr:type I-C CRISPR-associated protein Cas8c/Csd1 [Lapidilactobacillus wuchangensis]
MTLFSDLIDVYQANTDQIGQETELQKRHGYLLPVAAATQRAQIEVTVNKDGTFRHARVVDKDHATTVIPTTIDSANRTTQIAPHPLHDKLEYVAGDYLSYGGKKKKAGAYQAYLTALGNWVDSDNSHPRVKIIYEYLKQGTLVHDLVAAGILFVDSEQKVLPAWPKESTQEKPPIFSVITGNDQLSAFVRFDTVDLTPVWEDKSIFDSYYAYYQSTFDKADASVYGLDYVTGKKAILTDKSPRFIRNPGDGAKIISGNDSSGYTYRGRFTDKSQVVQVGLASSQKAHNALTWLISLQGSQIDGRVYLTWLSNKISQAPDITASSTETIRKISSAEELPLATSQIFSHELNLAMLGYRTQFDQSNYLAQAHLLQLDAAVPGRLAILDYRTINQDVFFNRLMNWYETTSWRLQIFEDKKPKQVYGTPSLRKIAQAALGENTKDSLIKSMVSTLIPCVIDEKPIPLSIVRNINNRTSRPTVFKESEQGRWRDLLSIACSVNRKFYQKEEFTVALNEETTDRSYLFGRLLAIADVVEARVLWSKSQAQGKTTSTRSTNALRYMSTFSVRPMSTLSTIHNALLPYLEAATAQGYYQRIWGEVITKFSEGDYNDQPLNGKYLLGYYSQREALLNKNKMTEVESND